MILRQVLELFDVLDSPTTSGIKVKEYLTSVYAQADVFTETVQGEDGSTDLVIVKIPGTHGKTAGGNAPTTGIIGQLGALGARPDIIGFVSDGDGALCALAVAAKALDMKRKGDNLKGDVIIATHVTPNATTTPNYPVPFIKPPVEISVINRLQVSPDMDVVFSVDATKGNQIINYRGFAISPVVKEGYILPVSNDLLDLVSTTTGKLPNVFPLTQYDITPYESGFRHINSILSPNIYTTAPTIGVAITAQTAVAGSAPGANHYQDLEEAGRLLLEAAKAFGGGTLNLYDAEMFAQAQARYGSLAHFQTNGDVGEP